MLLKTAALDTLTKDPQPQFLDGIIQRYLVMRIVIRIDKYGNRLLHQASLREIWCCVDPEIADVVHEPLITCAFVFVEKLLAVLRDVDEKLLLYLLHNLNFLSEPRSHLS